MTGPEHYTTAEELTKEAATHRAKAEEYLEKARGSFNAEYDGYVSRAQVHALLYSGQMAQAQVHATLAGAAATALTGPVAQEEGQNMDLEDWNKVASPY
ncbi:MULTISPECIES: hypothetical protein [unclassified Nonomuraea]|uniref:hypothetical protein n=1 Tax=unclassified Nonomuraea TaxID=2593643 RepID=UPI00340FE402